MKTRLKNPLGAAMLVVAMSLSACGIGGYWMNGDPSAGKNVKPLGAHWTKPSVSTEEWRADWVGCGGMADGGYATDVPPRSPTKAIFEASKLKRQALAVCMREKGYVFTPDAVFREP